MGKKGKGKGKKGPEDWGARDVEKYVTVEIRNSVWQSMRFTQLLGTSTKLSHLVQVRPAHGRAAQSHLHIRAQMRLLAQPILTHSQTSKCFARSSLWTSTRSQACMGSTSTSAPRWTTARSYDQKSMG